MTSTDSPHSTAPSSPIRNWNPGAPEPSNLDARVPTAVGDLGAIIRIPGGWPTPLPGVVMVDGAGDGDRYDWGGWPDWVGDAGSVVLRHDKPGCGGSPGHWREQTLQDRAKETLAAVATLRKHPATAGRPIGLYGISQGGWVALLAAARQPEVVDFVICHSGPGTTPAAQERDRIEAWVRGADHPEAEVSRAMAWVDQRLDRMRTDEASEAILADQQQLADEPWYGTVTFAYDTAEDLTFIRGIIDFDPVAVLPQVHCPLLALFGGNDTVVAAQTSLAIYAEHLPPDPANHGFAVFPGADHGLFVAARDPAVLRREQLAPGYLPTVTAFLADRGSAAAG